MVSIPIAGTSTLTGSSSHNAVVYTEQVARLLAQEKGLFPPALVSYVRGDILDVSCGSGWWSHQIAHAHPDCFVTGINHDAIMIVLAKQLAPSNATYMLVDACSPFLPLSEATVDFLHLNWMVYPFEEPGESFLAECFRLLRPGGALFLQTCDQICISNDERLTAYNDLLINAYRRSGQFLLQGTLPTGPIAALSAMLEQVGFSAIQGEEVLLSCSAGAPRQAACHHFLACAMAQFRPLILQHRQDMAKERLAALEEEAQEALRRLDFVGFLVFQHIWALKQEGVCDSALPA